jgi:hypothetical protein
MQKSKSRLACLTDLDGTIWMKPKDEYMNVFYYYLLLEAISKE